MIDSTPIVPNTVLQKQLKLVLNAVKHTKSYEKLLQTLKEKPEPLFEPPLNSKSNFYLETEESIRKKSDKSELKLAEDPEAELLTWTSSKLNVSKLPAYYLSLSKSRLTLLVCITAAGEEITICHLLHWFLP